MELYFKFDRVVCSNFEYLTLVYIFLSVFMGIFHSIISPRVFSYILSISYTLIDIQVLCLVNTYRILKLGIVRVRIGGDDEGKRGRANVWSSIVISLFLRHDCFVVWPNDGRELRSASSQPTPPARCCP